MRLTQNFTLVVSALLITIAIAPGCGGQVASHVDEESADRLGGITALPNMSTKRAAHTATLLDDGKVLVVGGFVAGGRSLSSAELFDPATNRFTPAGAMTVPRAGHTATRLPNGKVLIVGGYDGDYLNTSEIYDPAAKRFTPAAKLVTSRSEHVATKLLDGKILIAGGVGTGWTFLRDAEIYDPATGAFTATGGMSAPRESHTSTLLGDGRVLITGGHKDRRSNMTIYRTAEIYEPRSGTFVATGNLTIKRHKHDAVRLVDGRVLIVGGSDERDGGGAYNNAEVFDPVSGQFTAVANNMNTARYKLQGTALLLSNGKVLIAGGADRAEIFDPETNSFLTTEGNMGSTRLFATATLLSNGSVLITGGYRDGNNVSEGAWIFRS